jgi:hypothetical protein
LDIVADSEHQSTPVRLLDGRKVDGDKECMGYFGVALQVALHELQTSNSFEQSMIRIMEIGGTLLILNQFKALYRSLLYLRRHRY